MRQWIVIWKVKCLLKFPDSKDSRIFLDWKVLHPVYIFSFVQETHENFGRVEVGFYDR
jgi:hypothetical protein